MNARKITQSFMVLAMMVFQVYGIEIIWGPVVEKTQKNSTVIRIKTDVSTTASVQYGVSGVDEHTVTGAAVSVHHAIMLQDLDSNQTYVYTVTAGDAARSATFSTLPGRGQRAHIALHGDVQGSGDRFYRGTGPAMFYYDSLQDHFNSYIMLGDFVDHGEESTWNTYFNRNRLLHERIPFYPVWGNHDEYPFDDTVWTIYKVFPDYGPEDKLYYSFDVGDAHFTVVNVAKLRDNFGYTEQVEWLKNDLDTSTAQFKFVCGHYNYFSFSPYTYTLPVMTEILLEHGPVDAYFCGHYHQYQRSRPLCLDPVGDTVMACDSGMVHFTAGIGGPVNGTPESTEFSAYGEVFNGWVDLVVENGVATVRALGNNWNYGGVSDWETRDGMQFSQTYSAYEDLLVKDSLIIDKRSGPITRALETAVAEDGKHLTVSPNPFNPSTVIRITCDAGLPQVRIFDVHGTLVRDLSGGHALSGAPDGEYVFTWNAENLCSGVYFVTAVAGPRSYTGRVTLMR